MVAQSDVQLLAIHTLFCYYQFAGQNGRFNSTCNLLLPGVAQKDVTGRIYTHYAY